MSQNTGGLFENLRKFINLIDKLRDIGLQKYISLPRIVCLGTQSSGKSSLLEQIVGIDFLPRGDGVVTRRPLEMRLVNVSKSVALTEKQTYQQYAIFDELPDKKFYDFLKVKETINQLTDQVAGNKKGIVDKPIVLTIYSTSCPDLTMIDLPGITRIPLQGSDQPQNIEEITKQMAIRYCQDPKTIILCVISANQDLSVNDSLKIAMNLDPQGNRTLGVLTKIDIMDKGTDAKNVLVNSPIPLKLGYVGVKNRCQLDIINNKTVAQSLKEEQMFFASHPVYSTLPKGKVGTSALITKLTETLYTHIREYLPDLLKEMYMQIQMNESRLKELGPKMPENVQEKMQMLWQTLNQFIIMYNNSISGTYQKIGFGQEEPAGSHIRSVLSELYKEYFNCKICNKFKDEDIKKAIMKHEGNAIPGFPSIDAFFSLLIPQLKLLYDPAQECITEVYQILEELSLKILEKLLLKLPMLKTELTDTIITLFSEVLSSVKILLTINKNYKLFTSKGKKLGKLQMIFLILKLITFLPMILIYQNLIKEKNNKYNCMLLLFIFITIIILKQDDHKIRTGQDLLVYELRIRVDTYFQIVIKKARDTIPKLIGYFLVRQTQKQLKQVLFEAINKGKNFYDTMKDPPHIVEERKVVEKALDTLRNAVKLIKRDPDLVPLFKNLQDFETNENKIMTSETQKKKSIIIKDEDVVLPQAAKQFMIQPDQQKQQNSNPDLIITKNGSDSLQQQENQQYNNFKGQWASSKKQIFDPINNEQQKFQQQPQQLAKQQDQNVNQVAQQQNPQMKSFFGDIQPNKKQDEKTMAAGKQQGKSNEKDFITNTVDKSVDKMMENEKVQDGMKKAANQAAYQIVDKNMPFKGDNGKNPLAEFAGKQAETAIQNPNVQNNIKNAAKDGIKQEIKKPTFW